jgi:hypothetical protein
MSNTRSRSDKDELLPVALDHAWQWWQFRTNNGLQVLNFFLLASAILVAAYVSALSAHLFGVAGAIALLGTGASAASYAAGKRQSDVAGLAVLPLKEVQARMAESTGIDSLKMIDRLGESRAWPFGGRVMAHLMFPVAAAGSVAAAIYAWVGH